MIARVEAGHVMDLGSRWRLGPDAEQEPGDAARPDEWVPRGGDLASAIAHQHHVAGQHPLQLGELAAGQGAQQGGEKPSVRLGVHSGPRPVVAQADPGTVMDLAAGGRRAVEHPGDLLVGIIEGLPQHDNRPLACREALQQSKSGQRELLALDDGLQRPNHDSASITGSGSQGPT